MLSGPRNTNNRPATSRVPGVKGGVMIHKGGIVVNDGGFAAPGREAAGLVSLGMAVETVDNTTGANGDQMVHTEAGCFQFANSATDPVTAAEIGKDVYIEDDETVSKTDNGGARSPAGKCFDVDSAGVWVIFT